MKLDKLLGKLKKTLDDDKPNKAKSIKRLETLIEELEAKAKKVERKLGEARSDKKREKLKLEAKIVGVEHRKAVARLEELRSTPPPAAAA